jgi:hypothetical protein
VIGREKRRIAEETEETPIHQTQAGKLRGGYAENAKPPTDCKQRRKNGARGGSRNASGIENAQLIDSPYHPNQQKQWIHSFDVQKLYTDIPIEFQTQSCSGAI